MEKNNSGFSSDTYLVIEGQVCSAYHYLQI